MFNYLSLLVLKMKTTPLEKRKSKMRVLLHARVQILR